MTGPVTPHHSDTPSDAPPGSACVLFGERLELAERYAAKLAEDGAVRGLIGPREVARLWDRHLLNSAVLCDVVPYGARVVDIGTGAGLPGIPMAIRRPDLVLDLVEPMQRRIAFLHEAVVELGLEDSVRITRGRADEAATRAAVGDADWVVARAVAPLDRLVRWCLPLLSPTGRLLALKGASAAAEVAEHRAVVRRLGGRHLEVLQLGIGVLDEPTWVVVVGRSDRPAATAKGRA